jgi:alpha-L-fucosidase
MIKLLTAAAPAAYLSRVSGQTTSGPATIPTHPIAAGPFQPSWESLVAQYKCPEWFRDAKFGIWAHWNPQCVPEQGDWYARQMYIQGHRHYDHHLKNYGHPSKFGFMEVINTWKAERWEPEKLIELYKRAGAKYFFALANHHDNFDCYNSKYHAWNSVNVGPKMDIVGRWAKAVREAGLKFGVSNHAGHASHWFQTAYGYDPEGPLAGVRYDAYTLTKADGQGKWWEGLDPQDLYTGRVLIIPDGIRTIAAARNWHQTNMDRAWEANSATENPAFSERFFLRTKDLIDQYEPDILYFDNDGLPLGSIGLEIAAHFYNSSIRRSGKLDVVLNGKWLKPNQVGSMTEDIERGVATEIRELPWQTDTCIGNWDYDRELAEQHRYKTPLQVVQMLIDIVSKNGNLMLNIPVRSDGTIDADEVACVEGISKWMQANDDGIYSTRPWKIYGEGPSTATTGRGRGSGRDVRSYSATDYRFTAKGDTVYAFMMGWPESGKATIKSLAEGSQHFPRQIARVELLGSGPLTFTRDAAGLVVTLPDNKPNDYPCTLKIIPS